MGLDAGRRILDAGSRLLRRNCIDKEELVACGVGILGKETLLADDELALEHAAGQQADELHMKLMPLGVFVGERVPHPFAEAPHGGGLIGDGGDG